MIAREFIVVGAGLGGLATALRLAHLGHRVTVLEKTDQVGGRNRGVRVNDCEFDVGPTLLMMLDPFRKLFADVGESFDERLEINACEPNYRVFFGDGVRLDCSTDVGKMREQMEALGAERDARKFPDFLRQLASLYAASVPTFVRRNYDSPLALAHPEMATLAMKHGMMGNFAKRLAREIESPRLRTLFSLQTMYVGLSPYDAPWVYAVLLHMEYGEGIWYPKGGLRAISRVVAEMAIARGATIRLNTTVTEISGNRVRMEDGETLSADAIVCNADLPYAEQKLLGEPKKRRRSSCSAYNLYIDYEGDLPGVLHHNIVLGNDFEANLEQVFHRLEIPTDPAFYMAASCRTEPGQAPRGHLNLQLLIPCPNLEHEWTETDAAQLKLRAFDRLEREFGFDRGHVRGMATLAPPDWNSLLNLDLGATFGLSHHLLQSACFRPSNRSRSNRHLYFVGASTVPGNGLPMVLISAELVIDRLVNDGWV